MPDGRFHVVTVGTDRFRVVEWLDDNPYPQANVELWPDTDEGIDVDRFGQVHGKFRRCLALASEAGFDTGTNLPDFEPGPGAVMQLAAMLPVGSFDKHHLLGVAGASERLSAIDNAIDDAMELIELRLRSEQP